MERVIHSIELRTDLVKVVLRSVPDKPGTVGSIFTTLGEGGFNVEAIAQSGAAKDRCDGTFAVQASDAQGVLDYLRQRLATLDAKGVLIDRQQALLVLFGEELSATPGAAGRVFSLMGKLGINVETISAGLVSLAFMVPKTRAEDAVRAIKKEFDLT